MLKEADLKMLPALAPDQSCEGKGVHVHHVFQSLPIGFHLSTLDTPFWTLSSEEYRRHQNYEKKSNNWLKRHGQPMRRRCMGVKCRKKYMILDEMFLVCGQSKDTYNYFAGLYQRARR